MSGSINDRLSAKKQSMQEYATGADLTAGMKFHERKKMSNNADIEYSLKEEIFPVDMGRLKVQRLSLNSQKDRRNTDRSPSGGMNMQMPSP